MDAHTGSPGLKLSIAPTSFTNTSHPLMHLTASDTSLAQWSAGPGPVTKANLTGKTVIVIGANTGIGFQAAKHFATMKPAKVIVACRNKDKGVAAVSRLRQETGTDNVELQIVDLSKFSSVKDFVVRVEKEEDRLDVLVANAGVLAMEHNVTEDGWEETLQVNDLSAVLMCILLLPLMIKTSEKNPGTRPRIVVVGSTSHYLLTQGLEQNRKLRNLRIHSRFLTTLRGHRRMPFVRRDTLKASLLRTAEEGSRQILWAALAHEEDPSLLRGSFVTHMKVTEPSDYVISEAGSKMQERIWKDIIQELSKVEPRVMEILDTVSR
ncbi:NAD(P)-binding protein [Coprinopsis marcescibilis]|uniref:NAD(P)-binding protein n=1 Tax=Coprinopsis marcescibilis TaxID=230819 RepID=A0A5C3KPS4_COPMA|nr:NAD(P)-binding protein [Coprinopsis marcescibilis]